jgi:hypothetical protein
MLGGSGSTGVGAIISRDRVSLYSAVLLGMLHPASCQESFPFEVAVKPRTGIGNGVDIQFPLDVLGSGPVSPRLLSLERSSERNEVFA